jgi:putative transposase
VLSVWLLKLDIWPDRIAPAAPIRTAAPNACTERSARTSPIRRRRRSNSRHGLTLGGRTSTRTVPHEALGQRCPATFYQPSPRAYPESIRAWEYPADHHVRRVASHGYIKWRDGGLYLTEALRGETVALVRRDDGDWTIRFRGFDLATLSDTTAEIRRSGLARTPQPGPGRC